MALEFAFIECPTRLDPDRAFVVSGHRMQAETLDVFPFGFGVSLCLDERSQNLLGMETVTISETELVTDCVSDTVPVELPEMQHRRKASSHHTVFNTGRSKAYERR